VATGNMQTNLAKFWPYGFRDPRTERQTNRHTHDSTSKYCHEYVCLSVCLSIRIMLPVATLRSSSGGVVMLCTSGFVDDVTFSHIGPYGAQCVFVSDEKRNSRNYYMDSNRILLNDKD